MWQNSLEDTPTLELVIIRALTCIQTWWAVSRVTEFAFPKNASMRRYGLTGNLEVFTLSSRKDCHI